MSEEPSHKRDNSTKNNYQNHDETAPLLPAGVEGANERPLPPVRLDSRFERPHPAAWKRALLIGFVVLAFYSAFSLRKASWDRKNNALLSYPNQPPSNQPQYMNPASPNAAHPIYADASWEGRRVIRRAGLATPLTPRRTRTRAEYRRQARRPSLGY
ncbi:hypothetical protein CYLTODRAFT_58223 [Cylindrobasidium torrendii FP15055 ss-10]|uniref:Transmembrane protein n=1 Tax=Cylindrobasidium torrendii FP15055 ss-10 TaxID=1314674 RepID=A0A0D7B7X0_9AGAR|nr:hypothetical protein CYLTODRAFT_58223 [Cylindrobasidium torrendii FP15055 ss-10]